MRSVLVSSMLLLVACGSVDIGEATASDPTSTTLPSETTTTAPTTTAPTTTAPTTTAPTTTAPTTTAPTTTARHQRERPADPLSLADDLTEAERAIRSDEITDTDAAEWGRRLQHLYRVLSANRQWATETITAVEVDVRPDVELNWEARQELSTLVGGTALSPTLPAWRIRRPIAVEQLLVYYKEAEETTGVPWEILAAINLIETRLGRIEGLSSAGALGPMQFLPATWAGCCEGDVTDDRDAIIGAGTYLQQLGAVGDLDRALFGYNNSASYVRAVRAYADVMERNESAFRGYHAFEVFFLSSAGLIELPVGYEEPEPVDAADWLADHPDALVE